MCTNALLPSPQWETLFQISRERCNTIVQLQLMGIVSSMKSFLSFFSLFVAILIWKNVVLYITLEKNLRFEGASWKLQNNVWSIWWTIHGLKFTPCNKCKSFLILQAFCNVLADVDSINTYDMCWQMLEIYRVARKFKTPFYVFFSGEKKLVCSISETISKWLIYNLHITWLIFLRAHLL
jgi:hypothetical protein